MAAVSFMTEKLLFSLSKQEVRYFAYYISLIVQENHKNTVVVAVVVIELLITAFTAAAIVKSN